MRYVISDIHGCTNTLNGMLWDKLKITKDDTVYFTGDYSDRGPNSRAVLDLLFDKIDCGYKFELCLGNHEAWLLEQYRLKFTDPSWLTWGGNETLKSFGVNSVTKIDPGYINKLSVLPTMIVLDDWVLVHAGLNFHLDDPIWDSLEDEKIWARGLGKADKKKLGGRRVIVGHTPENLDTIKFYIKANSTKISLDNCVYSKDKSGKYGNLCAYCLDTNELFIQPTIDKITWESPRKEKTIYSY